MRSEALSLYPSQRTIAKEFDMNFKTVAARLKEMRELTSRYGKHAIIDDGNIVLVYRPAFTDYMANRRRLMDVNARKYVEPYDPGKIIRELSMDEWGRDLPDPAPEVDKETVKKLMREILMEGLSA